MPWWGFEPTSSHQRELVHALACTTTTAMVMNSKMCTHSLWWEGHGLARWYSASCHELVRISYSLYFSCSPSSSGGLPSPAEGSAGPKGSPLVRLESQPQGGPRGGGESGQGPHDAAESERAEDALPQVQKRLPPLWLRPGPVLLAYWYELSNRLKRAVRDLRSSMWYVKKERQRK